MVSFIDLTKLPPMKRRPCGRCREYYENNTKGGNICDECSEIGNNRIWWEEKQVWGYRKLPRWLRNAYIRGTKGKCQSCNKVRPELEINKLVRGNKGGLYTVAPLKSKKNNVQVICKACHRLRHFAEKGCRSR